MERSFVLVHSPLVGPLTWQSVADRLRGAGVRAVVPSFTGVAPSHSRLAEAVAREVPESDEVVLVGHSSAGPLLPAIAAELGAVRLAIYVDAGLPHPGVSWFDHAPAEQVAQVRALARDGRLPRWNEWFPEEMITELLPDADLRARFIAELPETPLDYLAEPAPVVPEPRGAHLRAYLQFSDAYAPAMAEARRRGWRTEHLPSDHFAMLTRPESVTGALLALAG